MATEKTWTTCELHREGNEIVIDKDHFQILKAEETFYRFSSSAVALGKFHRGTYEVATEMRFESYGLGIKSTGNIRFVMDDPAWGTGHFEKDF